MNFDVKGRVVHEGELTVDRDQLDQVARAIGTSTAPATAPLVNWFGATVGGDTQVVEALGMDLGRALLAGHGYRWRRPFAPGEHVTVRVVVDDVYAKGPNSFAVIVAEFRAADGELVQSQTTTFIEREAAS